VNIILFGGLPNNFQGEFVMASVGSGNYEPDFINRLVQYGNVEQQSFDDLISKQEFKNAPELYNVVYESFYKNNSSEKTYWNSIDFYMRIAKVIHTKDVASLPPNQSGLFSRISKYNFNTFTNAVEQKLVNRFDEYLSNQVSSGKATPLEAKLNRHIAHIEAFLKSIGMDMKDWDELKLAVVREDPKQAQQIWNKIIAEARDKTVFKTTGDIENYLTQAQPYQQLITPSDNMQARFFARLPEIKAQVENLLKQNEDVSILRQTVRTEKGIAKKQYQEIQGLLHRLEIGAITGNTPAFENGLKELTALLKNSSLTEYLLNPPPNLQKNLSNEEILKRSFPEPYKEYQLQGIALDKKIYVASTNPFKTDRVPQTLNYFNSLEQHNVSVIVNLADTFEQGNESIRFIPQNVGEKITFSSGSGEKKEKDATITLRKRKDIEIPGDPKSIHYITQSTIEIERGGIKKEYEVFHFHNWNSEAAPEPKALEFLSQSVAVAEKETKGNISVFDSKKFLRTASFITFHHSANTPDASSPRQVSEQFIHATAKTQRFFPAEGVVEGKDNLPVSTHRAIVLKNLTDFIYSRTILKDEPPPENTDNRLLEKMEHFVEGLEPPIGERILYRLSHAKGDNTAQMNRDILLAFMLENNIKYTDLKDKIRELVPPGTPIDDDLVFAILDGTAKTDPAFAAVKDLDHLKLYPEAQNLDYDKDKFRKIFDERNETDTPENRLKYILEKNLLITNRIHSHLVTRILSDEAKFNDIPWLQNLGLKLWANPEIARPIMAKLQPDFIPQLSPEIFKVIDPSVLNAEQSKKMTLPQWQGLFSNPVIYKLNKNLLQLAPSEAFTPDFFKTWDVPSITEFISYNPLLKDAQKLGLLKQIQQDRGINTRILQRTLVGSLKPIRKHQRDMHDLLLKGEDKPYKAHQYLGRALEQFINGIEQYIALKVDNESFQEYFPAYYTHASIDQGQKVNIPVMVVNHFVEEVKNSNVPPPTPKEITKIQDLYKNIQQRDNNFKNRADISYVLRIIKNYADKFKIPLE
jgi:hypothetical protein